MEVRFDIIRGSRCTKPEKVTATATHSVTAKAVSQTEPIRLELLGTTEYDSDNQTRIRPLFRGRVDRVYAKVGQLIAKGEPLIEFYSTDLAEAKNACDLAGRFQPQISLLCNKPRHNRVLDPGGLGNSVDSPAALVNGFPQLTAKRLWLVCALRPHPSPPPDCP